jgi:hypothetical protein
MFSVARYGYDGYKHAREWLPHVELTPRKIDWLHGGGSLAAGSVFGFENLSLPSIPTLLWAGAGTFSLFEDEAQCVPQGLAARSIGAGAMVAVAGVVRRLILKDRATTSGFSPACTLRTARIRIASSVAWSSLRASSCFMPHGIMPDSARQEGSATTYGLINRCILAP